MNFFWDSAMIFQPFFYQFCCFKKFWGQFSGGPRGGGAFSHAPTKAHHQELKYLSPQTEAEPVPSLGRFSIRFQGSAGQTRALQDGLGPAR